MTDNFSRHTQRSMVTEPCFFKAAPTPGDPRRAIRFNRQRIGVQSISTRLGCAPDQLIERPKRTLRRLETHFPIPGVLARAKSPVFMAFYRYKPERAQDFTHFSC